MKILLLSNKSPWPPTDGGAAATLGMMKGLVQGGASVTVLALNPRKHFVPRNSLPPEIISGFETRLVDADAGIKPLSFLKNLFFSDKPYTLERFESQDFEKILSSVAGNHFDIIQVEGLAMTGYLKRLRKISGARIVYRPHNVESRIWEQLSSEERNPFKRLYFRILASRTAEAEKRILNSFDALVAITETDLEWFKTSGLTSPSIVCPAGFPWLKPGYHEGNPNQLFFIGSLDWLPNIKGLNWFLRDVWPAVNDAIPDAVFHIAGRNPAPGLKKMCTGKNIRFYGEVESSSDFMLDKQVMVVPLFSGSGLRMKIIEGMSMGKSIVATPEAVRGVRYSEGRDIFISSEAKLFAHYITSLLGNPSIRRETGLNAIENVRKNYNIFASAKKLINFYSQIT